MPFIVKPKKCYVYISLKNQEKYKNGDKMCINMLLTYLFLRIYQNKLHIQSIHK